MRALWNARNGNPAPAVTPAMPAGDVACVEHGACFAVIGLSDVSPSDGTG